MKIIDQILHVVVFGALAWIHPNIGLAGIVLYELCDFHWKVGPLSIGQWPPGKPFTVYRALPKCHVRVAEMDRVEDLRLDLMFELLGVGLGVLLRGYV